MTYGGNIELVQPGEKAKANTAPMYVWNYFNGKEISTKTMATNGDGSITLFGGGYANGQISSGAASAANSKKFVGTAFGGGAYFEAVFKFDGWQGQATNPQSMADGFPAFWAMSVEHLAISGLDTWPSKPAAFKHFEEFDFFEYNAAYQEHQDTMYTGSIHDWYGVFNATCPLPANGFCQVSNRATNLRDVPTTFNFSQYHTYGALWIPATDTQDGSLEWFLDGVAIGQKVTWKKMENEASLSWPAGYAYAVADLQHMAIIFGSGTPYPMTIKSVNVWQASAKDNWVE